MPHAKLLNFSRNLQCFANAILSLNTDQHRSQDAQPLKQRKQQLQQQSQQQQQAKTVLQPPPPAPLHSRGRLSDTANNWECSLVPLAVEVEVEAGPTPPTAARSPTPPVAALASRKAGRRKGGRTAAAAGKQPSPQQYGPATSSSPLPPPQGSPVPPSTPVLQLHQLQPQSPQLLATAASSAAIRDQSAATNQDQPKARAAGRASLGGASAPPVPSMLNGAGPGDFPALGEPARMSSAEVDDMALAEAIRNSLQDEDAAR